MHVGIPVMKMLARKNRRLDTDGTETLGQRHWQSNRCYCRLVPTCWISASVGYPVSLHPRLHVRLPVVGLCFQAKNSKERCRLAEYGQGKSRYVFRLTQKQTV